MDFIDLKTQYRRIKPAVDARIARVLEHGAYVMGPEVSELEHVLADYCGTTALRDGGERLGRVADRSAGPRDRSRRRGHHRAVHVFRDRRDDRADRRETGLRRHRSTHLQHGSGTARGGHHAAHESDHASVALRPVRRFRRDQRDCERARPAGHRGRGPEFRRDLQGSPLERVVDDRGHVVLSVEAARRVRRRRRALHQTTTRSQH